MMKMYEDKMSMEERLNAEDLTKIYNQEELHWLVEHENIKCVVPRMGVVPAVYEYINAPARSDINAMRISLMYKHVKNIDESLPGLQGGKIKKMWDSLEKDAADFHNKAHEAIDEFEGYVKYTHSEEQERISKLEKTVSDQLKTIEDQKAQLIKLRETIKVMQENRREIAFHEEGEELGEQPPAEAPEA